MTPHRDSPFHLGEITMQLKAGKRENAEVIGRNMIREFMPDQHREFYAQLPFLVAGAVDDEGRPWATLVTGSPGFVSTPDAVSLQVEADSRRNDPVIELLTAGREVGLLGIELPTRRRNRVNGRVRSRAGDTFVVDVTHSFGNCPQYIQIRDVQPQVSAAQSGERTSFTGLPEDVSAFIRRADTFFVSSVAADDVGALGGGVDVSHRGGPTGFVEVSGNSLTVPDYRGNNIFNTLGNFLTYPKAGLVFVDFDQGDLLQLTGDVELHDADRTWQVSVSSGQWLHGALPYSFGEPEFSPRNL